MIKIFILLLGIYCCITPGKVSAQINKSESQSELPSTKADLLLKKARNQKTFGWILAGVGATVGLITLISVDAKLDRDLDSYLYKRIGTGGYIVTGTLWAASIPLFIASTRNKKKAAAILKYESIGFLPPAATVKGFWAVGIHTDL